METNKFSHDELHLFLKYTLLASGSTLATTGTETTATSKAAATKTDVLEKISPATTTAHATTTAATTAAVTTTAQDGGNDESEGASGEKYFDPVTGEPISKNAFKKLQKNVGKKEKKEKPAPVAAATASATTEEKEKKEKKKAAKEPEIIHVDTTPSGEKKQLTGVFPSAYQPKYVEAAWQSWWEKCGFYTPNVTEALQREEKDKFVMVIPPPNVTGSLHLGHALTTAIEDTITRYHRMNGKTVLWLPGVDHAGIATQSVVEKRLKKENNLTRHDLGRDEFVKRVWEWKEKYGGTITGQIRSLGASVDWSREAFTMDANLSRAVTEAFVRFSEDGLIYRDTRLINWSCSLQSAISEIEVDYIDLEGKTFLAVPNHKNKEKYEFGTITSFAYKVYDSKDNEEIVVATTRLETMLGDTAVAVHPDDKRYQHLHGKFLIHPFVKTRKIPIVTDGELVDMSFGTGAVKVTPAHDPNDYNCGKRHQLDFIIVLSKDGKITSSANNDVGEFAGMMRYDARIAIEQKLQELGLYRGKEPNKMRLGICSRSGDIIEPMLTPQWYVNCSSMAAKSVAAVRNGDLKIIPESHEATWYRWLENSRDWCISRQLWWGHRIPAYFATTTEETNIDKDDPMNNYRWVVARTKEQAVAFAAKALKTTEEKVVLQQDEDVLDTWFSSSLFPFSVFGWPNETEDFKAFYPTSLLETGADILFFWVARMVMMGLHLTGKLPFKTVYLHSMVRDKYGQKMSKSRGNVIDPLEVINGCTLNDLLLKIDQGNLPEKEVIKSKEAQRQDFPEGIPECGADALRFGLLAYTSQGRDINLDIKRVVGYRQFCNKLWNAVRFALQYLTDFVPTTNMANEIVQSANVSKRDIYILSKLNATIQQCNDEIGQYNFGAVASALHSFFLYDTCDLYLELIKPIVQTPIVEAGQQPIVQSEEAIQRKKIAQATLFTVLEQFLRLAHPLMPFVTEELWQRLPGLSSFTSIASIMISPYPVAKKEWNNVKGEEDMDVIKDIIHAARSLRADYRIANHIKCEFYFKTDAHDVKQTLIAQSDDFATLSKANFLKYLEPTQETPKGCCLKVLPNITLFLDLTGVVNIEQELQRLSKELERLEPTIEQYKRKAAAPGYDKVPEEVRATNAEKLAAYEAELLATKNAILAFEAMK